MTKKEVIIEFFKEKQGYLKKSPLEAAKSIWKNSPKYINTKSNKDLEKDLKLIKDIQSDLRLSKKIENDHKDNTLDSIYNRIIELKNKPIRRLFFDIETSPNIVYSWNIGRKINLDTHSIVKERAIICICYKWEGEDKVYSLTWNKGDDKTLLEKFSKIIDSCDEVIGHNSDQYDIKWVRARCIYHGIKVSPKFNSVDTLKLSRANFRFNSNKLDYISRYLGIGKKIDTGGFDLWKGIIENNDKEALNKMVTYCKGDVELLEKVYKTLKEYTPTKKFKYKI